MRRVGLVVLDGWGYRRDAQSNAVLAARTPRLTALADAFPGTTLGASGLDVGLPEGQMGNSEVGHLNLGAGRIVYQDYTRINLSIQTGEFFSNAILLAACRQVCGTGGTLHLLGLLSDGGVHSHEDHLYALVELAQREGVERVCVHAFLDGRDTPPQSGRNYLEALERRLAERGLGHVATVMGRFYAMDRDTRWDRVEEAFRAMVLGEGDSAQSSADAIARAYAEGQTDEFVKPRVIRRRNGDPVGPVRGGDGIVFYNFRADRARELTRAFTQPGFDGFDVAYRPKLAAFVTFTEYDETFTVPVAFPPERLVHIYGEVLSDAGLRQLRIAETEKYAHVTFFFNGGEEKPFPGEERVLIPSPREVATYDQKPEMSAFGVRDRLVDEIRSRRHDAIVVNFANLDMVGHTGDIDATIRAVEVVDQCVGDVVEALLGHGYAAAVTADHGNAELMWDPGTGQPHTAHTLSRVPFLLVDTEHRDFRLREGGILADVAPTLLAVMGLSPPAEMTGRSLLGP